jgi:hypothetical protein
VAAIVALTAWKARPPLLWATAAAALVVAAAVLLLLRDDRPTDTVVSFSREALQEPFLAAHQFLGGEGVVLELRRGLRLPGPLPRTDRTLMITGIRQIQTDPAAEALLGWIDRGGHLLVVANSYWDDDTGTSGNVLLDRLGVRLQRAQPAEVPVGLEEPVPDELRHFRMMARGPLADCGPAAGVLEVAIAGAPAPAHALLPWRRRLAAVPSDMEWATLGANRAGTQIMQSRLGAGLVTVMTSAELWRNDYIHCHDHAYLLRQLSGGAVTWVDRVAMASLPQLLWQRFPVVLLALALVLLLFLWHLLVRPGPVLPTGQPARRALLDHVDGVARFFWQQRATAALLAPLQREVADGIARRARHSGSDRERTLRDLAVECGLTPGEAAQAVASMHTPRPQEFTRTVEILKLLRDAL